MHDYLKTNLPTDAYHRVVNKCNVINQESRLCELLLEIIHYCESALDRHVDMFDAIFSTILKIKDLPFDGTNFRVN